MLSVAAKVDDLVRQATELDSSDRAKLITELLKTLDPPGENVEDFPAAWSDELDRREREIEDGAVELVDWDTVRASFPK